jgi:hypothetical protein
MSIIKSAAFPKNLRIGIIFGRCLINLTAKYPRRILPMKFLIQSKIPILGAAGSLTLPPLSAFGFVSNFVSISSFLFLLVAFFLSSSCFLSSASEPLRISLYFNNIYFNTLYTFN